MGGRWEEERGHTSRGGDGSIRTKGQRDPTASRNGGASLRAHVPAGPRDSAATAEPATAARATATATAAAAAQRIIAPPSSSLLSASLSRSLSPFDSSASEISPRVEARFGKSKKNKGRRGLFGGGGGVVVAGGRRGSACVLLQPGWLGRSAADG